MLNYDLPIRKNVQSNAQALKNQKGSFKRFQLKGDFINVSNLSLKR